jgi:hypothetical protein
METRLDKISKRDEIWKEQKIAALWKNRKEHEKVYLEMKKKEMDWLKS